MMIKGRIIFDLHALHAADELTLSGAYAAAHLSVRIDVERRAGTERTFERIGSRFRKTFPSVLQKIGQAVEFFEIFLPECCPQAAWRAIELRTDDIEMEFSGEENGVFLGQSLPAVISVGNGDDTVFCAEFLIIAYERSADRVLF